jgi:hypothetical protein
VGAAFGRALVAAGADRLGGLGLDQRLQPRTNQLGEHRAGIGADFNASS